MSSFQTIGVIGKRRDARVSDSLAQICATLKGLGREVLVETETAVLLPAGSVQHGDREELARRCQLVIVIGGDGTLLDAGRSLAACGVPILGVNQGRLGFLVDVRPEDIRETLGALLRGEYLSETRRLFEAVVQRRDGSREPPMLAVNDVVIRNLATIRMLEFETWLAGDGDGSWEFISQHRADGIIVSTPTGSTAYALSSGGPVMHPALDAVAVVPICPHPLSDRPIVVPAGRTIRILLGGDFSGATATCDGQISSPLEPGDAIEISRSPQALRLIHPRSYSYFELLRDKLHWGRNPGGAFDKA
ncbi:MAG: NAD(+) kinase [Nevskia sp.]